MDILIISQYIDSFSSIANDRFVYLANILQSMGTHHIEILTSDFNHSKKMFKEKEQTKYEVTYMHELGYKKNISVLRILSHHKLANNTAKYLKGRKKPDVIYCAVPSLSLGKVVARYAAKHNIRLIVDIQDLWPEAFEMVLHVPVVSKLLFAPMRRQADGIYAHADTIVAVSDTYRDRGLLVNKRAEGVTVFLGTDFKDLDAKLQAVSPKVVKNPKETWIGYLGTLGSSYDVITALKAMKLLQSHNENLRFIVLGDGPKMDEFKGYAEKNEICADFLGRLDYYEAMAILKQCDIALNPLVKGAAQSIINKVGDYAALSLPVVNSLESPEYRRLLEEYQAGINIACENEQAMADAVLRLVQDKEERKCMAQHSRKLGEDCFDRRKTYSKIVDVILGVEPDGA